MTGINILNKLLKSAFIIIIIIAGVFRNGNAQPLTGTKTIGTDYATIAAAITDINTKGVGSGGVIFNVPAGYTETFSSSTSGLITATGTTSNPVLFHKSGSGANPVITGTGTAGLYDGIIILAGSSYIAFDGIDVTDAGATIEWGYALLKASTGTGIGCQNVTIKNCNITLNNTDTSSVGIYSNTILSGGSSATISIAADAMNNCTFSNNNIQNCYRGVALIGYNASSPYSLYDQNNQVLNNAIQNTSIAITVPAFGILGIYQNNLVTNGNSISYSATAGSGGGFAIYGIFDSTAVNANFISRLNTITLTQAGANTGNTCGIRNLATGGNIVISNNTMQNWTAGGGLGNIYFIYNFASTSSGVGALSCAIDSNNISNNTSLNIGGGIYFISNCSTTPNVNVRNNTINNNVRTYGIATSAAMYGYFNSNSNVTGGYENIANNIFSNLNNGLATFSLYAVNTSTLASQSRTISGNTISNLTCASTIFGMNISNGSPLTVVSNNISGINSAATAYGIILSSINNADVYSNTISSITSTGTSGSAASYGINLSGSSNQNVNIYSNSISSISAAFNYAFGIYAGSGGSNQIFNIYSNTLNNISCSFSGTAATAQGVAAGIFLNGGLLANVYKNNIYGITETGSSAFSFASGIRDTITSLNVNAIFYAYNNFISDVSAPNSTSGMAVVGLYLSSTSAASMAYNVYYNTIFLNQAAGSSTFGSAGLYASSTTAVTDLRNNVIVNNSFHGATSGLTTAYFRSNSTLTTYSSLSNNNCLYAGTPTAANLIYYDGTNSDLNLSTFKTRVGSRDCYSVTENPPFINTSTTPYNLHVSASIATQLMSGGIPVSSPIAVTNDYDGQSRNSTTPCIGADEFSGIVSDLTAPMIVYTPLHSKTSVTSGVTLVATISDQSGVPVSGIGLPVLYWNKNGGAYSSVTASSLESNQYQFSGFASGLAVNDVINYFIVAQDLAGTPNIGSYPSAGAGGFTTNPPATVTPPSTPSTFTVVIPLNGTVSVGTGMTYTSLTENTTSGLFYAVNNGVLTGNLTVNIVSNITELGAVALNQWLEEGAGNYHITINPSGGAWTLSGSVASAPLIKLNGVNNVKIDGLNTGGNSLTISNTSTSATSVIQFINGSSGNTIINTTVAGAATSGTSGTIMFLTSNTSSGCSNNTISNCTITKNSSGPQANAIYLAGSPALTQSNNIITGNTITDFSQNGINYALNAYYTNTTISGNQIYENTFQSSGLTGISIGSTPVGTCNIFNNSIHDLKTTSTGSANIKAISIAGGIPGDIFNIYNNKIYLDGSISTRQPILYGLYFSISNGNVISNVFYNSIFIGGSDSATTSTNMNAGLALLGTAPAVNFHNNVIYNARTFVTGSSQRNVGIFLNATTNIPFLNSNNNDIYVSGGTNSFVGYINATSYTTLSDWKTVSSQDAYSLSGDPGFTSIGLGTVNLQPDGTNSNSWNLHGQGSPIASISTDIVGNPRSTSVVSGSTCIGAYEFTPSAVPLVPVFTPSTPASGIQTVTLSGRTLGTINWYPGAVSYPSSITMSFYPGTTPPSVSTGLYGNCYWLITVPDGSGYTYDLSLNYDPSMIGTVSSESNTILAKRDGSGTWNAALSSTLNTTNKTVSLTGLTNFSQFALTDNNNPLPVQLSSFTVSNQGRDVILKWKTQTEKNSSKFDIERKIKNTVDWLIIGEIKAGGFSNSIRQYSFNDKNIQSGVYNYRLKITDNDGRYEFSDIIEANISLPREFILEQNYPNPFNPSTKINYQIPVDSKVTLEIYNITGQKIGELLNMDQSAGYYSQEVGPNSLHKVMASGVYFYRLAAVDKASGKNFVSVKKMIMLK